MIKITKHIYIHILTVVLFAVCYVTRHLGLLLMAYAVITVHELSHLLAAYCIGLKASRVVFYPFGVNLKLKNRIIYSVSDEVILYLAGPFSNVVMAFVSIFFNFPFREEFYLQNIALFALNMLPVIPLDGGIILKKITARIFGYQGAERIMKTVSIILTGVFMVFGIYLSVINKFNYSIVFLSVFLVSGIFTSSEKYNVDFINELIYYKEKRRDGKRVKGIVACEGTDLKKIAEKFKPGYFYIVVFLDDEGNMEKTMTETEILHNLTKPAF